MQRAVPCPWINKIPFAEFDLMDRRYLSDFETTKLPIVCWRRTAYKGLWGMKKIRRLESSVLRTALEIDLNLCYIYLRNDSVPHTHPNIFDFWLIETTSGIECKSLENIADQITASNSDGDTIYIYIKIQSSMGSCKTIYRLSIEHFPLFLIYICSEPIEFQPPRGTHMLSLYCIIKTRGPCTIFAAVFTTYYHCIGLLNLSFQS